MPHLPGRSFVLLALALAVSALGTGCATAERATTEGRDPHTIRGDFGELDVQGALTVGEEGTIALSSRLREGQPFAALAFQGAAGTFVKVEVSPDESSPRPITEGAASELPEVVLLAAQGPTRAAVVSHGVAPRSSTLWFKLLHSGTHYVVAKDVAADPVSTPRRARVLVSEVLAPVARL